MKGIAILLVLFLVLGLAAKKRTVWVQVLMAGAIIAEILYMYKS